MLSRIVCHTFALSCEMTKRWAIFCLERDGTQTLKCDVVDNAATHQAPSQACTKPLNVVEYLDVNSREDKDVDGFTSKYIVCRLSISVPSYNPPLAKPHANPGVSLATVCPKQLSIANHQLSRNMNCKVQGLVGQGYSG